MFKRLAAKLFSRRTAPILAVAALAFLVPAIAYGADIGLAIGTIIAYVFEFFTRVLGFILLIFVKLLIVVAQYNDFVGPNAPSAVKVGWVVARDLANMFFIIVLIVISFGTILSIETYHYSKHLSKLLIMAIAINFSKTICGIFIDMGQVVMLTFVNGFSAAAGGNFVRAFQIDKLLALRADGDASGLGLAMGMFLAFVLVAISLGVVIAITVMLIWRVVTLWILIIVSPLAWMARAMPFGKASGYYADWWGKFTTNVMAGPTLAFFLWLALLSVQSDGGNIGGTIIKPEQAGISAEASTLQTGIPTQAAQLDSILSLIIVSAILMIGLDMAGKSGAVGAGAASAVKGRLQKYGNAAGAFAWRNTGGRAVGYTKERAVQGAGIALAKTGAGLSGLTGGKFGAGIGVRGQRLREGVEATRKKRSEERWGTSAERAKLSPAAFTRELAAETDMDKRAKLAKTVLADEKAAARIGKEPKEARAMLDLLDQARKEKPSLQGVYRDALLKNWKSLPEETPPQDGETDEQKIAREKENAERRKRRVEAFANFGKDDAAKLDQKFLANPANSPLIAAASSAAKQYLLSEGTDSQRAGMVDFYEAMANKPDGAQAVKDDLTLSRIDATKLTKDMMEKVPAMRSFAADKALANKDDRKTMMADKDMAAQLKVEMNERLAKAKPSEAGKIAVDAVSLKAMDNEELKKNTELLKKIAGSLDLKGLAQKINAPSASTDDKKAATTMMAAYAVTNPQGYDKVKGQPNYVDMIPTDDELAEIRQSIAGAGTTTATTTAPPPPPAAAAPAPTRDETNAAMRAAEQAIARLENNIANQPRTAITTQMEGERDSLKQAIDDFKNALSARTNAENRLARTTNTPADVASITKELEDLNQNIRRMSIGLNRNA